MRWFSGLVAAACVLALTVLSQGADTADIHVRKGESIQKSIDAANPGATIHIDTGVFRERLKIDKPITLLGAGPDQTIIKPGDAVPHHTDAEKIAFADAVEKAPSDRQLRRIVSEYLGLQTAPTISVEGINGVILRGLKIQGVGPGKMPGSGSESIVEFDHSQGQIIDCAIVGPSNDGIDIAAGSNVEIRHTLVAAVWSTGIVIGPGERGGQNSRALIDNCDIRNCYYAGIVLRGEGTTIENSRISGAAWHGIRYDDCSPTITGNFIFANARSGIYASGATHAIIRNNIFFKNEMDAISCWFNNTDTIENNTIYGNLREGISVLGNSKPLIAKNVLAANPVAVSCSAIEGQGDACGQPTMQNNWFWNNTQPIMQLTKAGPVPPDNTASDPHFESVADYDFFLKSTSPARQAGAGANEKVELASSWPTQVEETAIIPTTDTRSWDQWKKPPAIR